MDQNRNHDNGTPAAAGWRHAPGDPDGTVRYWDGSSWWGEPAERFDADSGRGRLVVDDSVTKSPAPATMLQRGVATIVDAAIAAAGAYGAYLAGALPEPVDPTEYTPAQYLDMVITFSAWVLFASLIWVTLDVAATLIKGRSIGKAAVDIWAVTTGTRATPRRWSALRRAAIKCCAVPVATAAVYSTVAMLSAQQQPAIVAGALVVAIFAAIPFASVRRRSAWDIAAATEVVDLRVR